MLRTLALCLLGALTATACTGDETDELGIQCEGKCDGLSSIKALVSDAKKLDLQDLINVGAGYATKELDDKLKVGDYNSLQLTPTELYAPASVAANDLTLKNLDTLVSGLAARFGEKALATEVNKVRADYLSSSGKRVYAEAAFRIRAGLGHNWSLPTKGFGKDAGGAVTLGFDAGVDLEARVITVHARESSGLVSAPLAAIGQTRGFVLPRSLDDLRAMSPGESFALSGKGRLGLNLGAGVPILVANPTSWLTYSVVLTAGLRSVVEGEMDIQAVRMTGDEVVVDVGVRTATLQQASIALTDGWGVQGLVSTKFDIGGISLDLGKLLDKALNQRVASKLSLIKAASERTNTSMRMSVARLRFHLDGSDPESGRGQALAQALRGDLRLAQALAARADSGVIADFDMVRSGASAISYAGIDLLGMSFYGRDATSEGQAVIQTPGGALSLMWESLHREGGWFFTSHGFTRIGVAGLRWDAAQEGVAKSETNLFLQTEEGDKFIARDTVMDQLDGLMIATAGVAAFRALEDSGNALQRMVLQKCPKLDPQNGWGEDCNIALVTGDSQVIALRAKGLADFDAATTKLSEDTRALLHEAADLRLAASSIEDPNASLVGPTASVVVDFRLDDTALKQIMGKDKVQLKNAVVSLMEATELDRTTSDPTGARTSIRNKVGSTADAMADQFEKYQSQYQRLMSIDGARIDTLGQIGGNAIEVRFTVDSSNRPEYEKAVSQSVAQSRAQVAGQLFDALRKKAGDMPGPAPHAEHIASFALLALAPVASTELRLNFKTDNSSSSLLVGPRKRYDAAGFKSLDRYAKGPMASPIAAGLFDIDAIIDAPK